MACRAPRERGMSRVQRALRRAAGAPLLHFVLIGGALFAFVAGRRPPARVGEVPTARQPVVITAAQVEQLRDDYARETGRAPSREEEAAPRQPGGIGAMSTQSRNIRSSPKVQM